MADHEFQHVNCMIERIKEVKGAMLGLKFLLWQLPQLPQWQLHPCKA